jgi:hypothetical protein
VRWTDGAVWVEDSVLAPRALSGESLRAGYWDGITPMTRGLIQARDRSLWLGTLELLRFGEPELRHNAVSWPIEGGLLAAGPGGRWKIEASRGRIVASVSGYRPRLPRAVYALTQLQVHHALIRLQLLAMRGRRPAAGIPADPVRRVAAGAIDVGLCAGITLIVARRRHRLSALAGMAAWYHVACWATSGRTVGGALMHQRVVAVDGSRLTLAQAAIRLVALPAAAVRLRAVHDDVAGTDVVAD